MVSGLRPCRSAKQQITNLRYATSSRWAPMWTDTDRAQHGATLVGASRRCEFCDKAGGFTDDYEDESVIAKGGAP